MAAITKRALVLENTLVNSSFNSETLRRARETVPLDFQPIDDVRASADYRIAVAKGFISRLFLELVRPNDIHRITRFEHQSMEMT